MRIGDKAEAARDDAIYDVPILDGFLAWIEEGEDEGLRPSTLANRRVFAKTAQALLAAESITRTGQITTPVLKAVLRRYAARGHPVTGCTPNDTSIQTFFVQIKTFCNFLWRERYLRSEKFYGWKRKKANDPKIRVWTTDQLAMGLRCVRDDYWDPVKHPEIAETWAHDEREKQRTRVTALYCLFVSSGLRRGEVMGLQRDDLDRTNKLISVRNSKTGGHREVPTTDDVIAAIDKMEKARAVRGTGGKGKRSPLRPGTGPENNFLFRNCFGEPLDGASTLRQIQRYLAWGRAQGMDMPAKFTLHALRHKAISAMLQVNPEHARLMAGHKDVSTTQRIYGHTLAEDVRETHTKTDVLARVTDALDRTLTNTQSVRQPRRRRTY